MCLLGSNGPVWKQKVVDPHLWGCSHAPAPGGCSSTPPGAKLTRGALLLATISETKDKRSNFLRRVRSVQQKTEGMTKHTRAVSSFSTMTKSSAGETRLGLLFRNGGVSAWCLKFRVITPVSDWNRGMRAITQPL